LSGSIIGKIKPLPPPQRVSLQFKPLPGNLGSWLFGMQAYSNPTRKNMEDDLNIFKMEDNRNFWEKEDYLIFLNLEDDLNKIMQPKTI
jgi:hypothetical protein